MPPGWCRSPGDDGPVVEARSMFILPSLDVPALPGPSRKTTWSQPLGDGPCWATSEEA